MALLSSERCLLIALGFELLAERCEFECLGLESGLDLQSVSAELGLVFGADVLEGKTRMDLGG